MSFNFPHLPPAHIQLQQSERPSYGPRWLFAHIRLLLAFFWQDHITSDHHLGPMGMGEVYLPSKVSACGILCSVIILVQTGRMKWRKGGFLPCMEQVRSAVAPGWIHWSSYQDHWGQFWMKQAASIKMPSVSPEGDMDSTSTGFLLLPVRQMQFSSPMPEHT